MQTPRGLLALAAFICGCAVSPERLAQKGDIEVCRSFGVYRGTGVYEGSAASYRAEIQRRALLNAEEWALVDANKINRGMSLCALYASWGSPSTENRSTGAWGTHIQHVYNAGLRYVRPTYVYTKNGRVSSWQN